MQKSHKIHTTARCIQFAEPDFTLMVSHIVVAIAITAIGSEVRAGWCQPAIDPFFIIGKEVINHSIFLVE
jgi:hypothetical protein